jgi:hypothetical protein
MLLYNNINIKAGPLLGLLLLIVSPSYTLALNASLSSSKTFFNYQEFSREGDRLDKESGWLTDFDLSIKTKFEDKHSVAGSFNYLFGRADYDGHLQNGSTHSTNTSENIFSYSASYSYQLMREYSVGLSLGQNIWQRDILEKNGALGLYEEYQWKNIFLYQQFGYQNFTIDVLTGVLVDGYMDIDLTESGFGEVHVPLKEGVEAQVKVTTQLPNLVDWCSYAYVGFIYREFPRSAPVNVGRFSISEPRSQLMQLSIGLSVDWGN